MLLPCVVLFIIQVKKLKKSNKQQTSDNHVFSFAT